MSKHSLTITYALPAAAAVTDGYWLRMEQEDVAEDVATVGDAATVIDSLFQLDACNPESASVVTELGQSNPLQALYPTSEEAAAALVTAAAEIDLAICDQESDGSVTVRIRVIRSHPNDPYRLRISGGTELEAIQTVTEISRTVTVQEATSHTLDYPVIQGFSGRWMGNVIARADQIPAINRTGNTLHWQDPATGTISCSYLTQYDLVTVRVAGVDGHQGAAMVRCFYHGLVEELEPELPEPAEEDASLCGPGNYRIDLPEDRVTCYKTIVTTKRCGCSNKEIASTTHDQVVPCPEWGPVRCPGTATECMHQLGTEAVTEYVDCTGDGDSSLASLATYQELCCAASPPANLPDCRVETRTWKGGVPIVNGASYYRQIYGRAVRIVPVAPNGGICGEWTIKQEVRTTDCCDLVDPPAWDSTRSAQVISDNSQASVFWADGLPPYTVQVIGTGFWVDRRHRQKTFRTPMITAEIFTGSACGMCTVTVTDACGDTARALIRSTTGHWVEEPGWAGSCQSPLSGIYPAIGHSQNNVSWWTVEAEGYLVDFYTSTHGVTISSPGCTPHTETCAGVMADAPCPIGMTLFTYATNAPYCVVFHSEWLSTPYYWNVYDQGYVDQMCCYTDGYTYWGSTSGTCYGSTRHLVGQYQQVLRVSKWEC